MAVAPAAAVAPACMLSPPLEMHVDGDDHRLAPAALLFRNSALVARVWPAFGELRSAARSAKLSTMRCALSALIAEARLIMGTCFLSAIPCSGL